MEPRFAGTFDLRKRDLPLKGGASERSEQVGVRGGNACASIEAADPHPSLPQGEGNIFAESDIAMIRKLPSGKYRLYSRKINPKTGRRRNLGTFATRPAAEKHERAVQYFKRH